MMSIGLNPLDLTQSEDGMIYLRTLTPDFPGANGIILTFPTNTIVYSISRQKAGLFSGYLF